VQDSFWNAQVSQVNITPNKTFEIIPVLGNQVIKLGNADSLQSKFDRLTAFYRQVWSKGSFEKYESISVEFSGQIVAVKRGAPKPAIDSAAAQRLIRAMQNGEDIVNDTIVAATTVAIQPASPINKNDLLAKQKKETAAAIKTNKPNNTKLNKQPLAAKPTTVKETKKEVLKSKKKA
jgi:cell division protein FtsQ